MSVQSQIDRIEQNVANTYAVLAGLGADMPSEQNSDNLAMTAGTAKAVLYSKQTLTEEQKERARKNIDASTVFSASTVDVTPSDVLRILGDGNNVILIHNDETFGDVAFTYFIYAADLGTITSSAVILYDDNVMAVQLAGSVSEPTWESFIVNLPQKSDIPTIADIIAALPVYGGETA